MPADLENAPTPRTHAPVSLHTYHRTDPANVACTASRIVHHHAGKKLCGTVQHVTVIPHCVSREETTGRTASAYGTNSRLCKQYLCSFIYFYHLPLISCYVCTRRFSTCSGNLLRPLHFHKNYFFSLLVFLSLALESALWHTDIPPPAMPVKDL